MLYWYYEYEYDNRCCRTGMQSTVVKTEGRYSLAAATAAAAGKSHTICHGALVESSRWLSESDPQRSWRHNNDDGQETGPRATSAIDFQIDRQQRTRGMASEQIEAAVLAHLFVRICRIQNSCIIKT